MTPTKSRWFRTGGASEPPAELLAERDALRHCRPAPPLEKSLTFGRSVRGPGFALRYLKKRCPAGGAPVLLGIGGTPHPETRARCPRLLTTTHAPMTLATQALARPRVERRGVARVMHGQVLSAATADALTTISRVHRGTHLAPLPARPELQLRPLVPPLVHRSPMLSVARAAAISWVGLPALRTKPHQHAVVTTDTPPFASTMRFLSEVFAIF